MTQWDYTLRVRDIVHDSGMSFEQKRDTIVSRIKGLPNYDEEDFDILSVVEELASAETPDEFCDWWGSFHDWANYERVWVEEA